MTTIASTRGGALTGRLLLLAGVVALSGLLASALVLPSAVAVDRVVGQVQRSVLEVPPLPDDIDEPAENSVILAADGRTVLAELSGVENRVLVSLAEVPRIAQNAVIATEDAEFWSHRGVDHRAIVRAALRNIESGAIAQGGSTITQQLVRNLPNIELTERSLDRKLTEAVWAVELERRMSKEEILEAYLNEVYLGNGVYGIGTAARYYFSRDVSELDLAEAALLAGMIRSPETNDPVDDPDAALRRRDIVVDQMLAQGFVSREEAEAATGSPLALDIQPRNGPVEPFFVDWVKRVLFFRDNELQPDVQAALGDTFEERRDATFKGGLVIHTTLDPRLQDLADATIRDYLGDALEDPLAALVSVEPGTGAVRSMAVGPKTFGECPTGEPVCERTKVIPAVPHAGSRDGRQPGSAFKPFIVAAALEEGFSPGWTVETTSGQTIEGCSDDGRPYRPANFEGGGGGYLDMYEAVQRSSNVYHVKLAAAVGVETVRDMATRLGIANSPNLSQFGGGSCSIALGTANVFPLEMANAFATLANHGERCEPFAVARIEDRRGNLVYQHEERCEQVLERGIADRVTDILQGPAGPGGTAGYVRGQLGRDVAGKTGTTNDFKDAWFVGYVPQLATAAWVGHEYPSCSETITRSCGSLFGVEAGGRFLDRVTGGALPGRMWADYVAAALEGVEVERFPMPPPVPTRGVPDVVGLLEEAATDLLEERDFTVVTRSVVHHEPVGTVVAQEPAAGSDVWIGGVVTLDVSDGTGVPPPVAVPDVLGLPRDTAVRLLTEAGFTVRDVDRETSDPAEDGVVLGQSPEPGAEHEVGQEVVLAVGRHAPGDGGGGDGDGDGGGDGGGGDGDGGGADGGGPDEEPSPSEEEPQSPPRRADRGGGGQPSPSPSPSPDGGEDG